MSFSEFGSAYPLSEYSASSSSKIPSPNHAAGSLTERYEEGVSWPAAAHNCSLRRTLIFRCDESGRPVLSSENRIVVTGACGFIGGNLVAGLRGQGFARIRAVHIKRFEEWCQRFEDVENLSLDLNIKENCETAAENARDIYSLAANMGGMGFIERNEGLCMLSVLIDTQMLQAAVKYGVKRYSFLLPPASTTATNRKSFAAPSLKEGDAHPALATAGKNCFPNGCVGIFGRILGCPLAWRPFTTCTASGDMGRQPEKSYPPRFSER